jgi:glutamyl-tRNA synthetase
MDEELEELAKKYALRNAVKHGGEANINSILSSLLGNHPEYRNDIETVKHWSEASGSWVSALTQDQQFEELKQRDPAFFSSLGEKREKVHELPELEGAEGGVVVRFAPGPSGPLHLGHSRAAILNDEFVKRYRGRYILRLEDTNPLKIEPEAYDMIPEDMDWLGVKVHEIAIQSDRFELYHEAGRRLLELGHAYVCTCDVEHWRELKSVSKACEHRGEEPTIQLDRWERMLDGTLPPGAASMVVKTDLEHSNPAVRDFVGFRILDEPHPRTGSKCRVYPTYNLSVAVDDHYMEMTHVLRGKDHLNNTYRQEYIYGHLSWPKPHFIHYGWVSIEDTVLKTSTIKQGIHDSHYTGWDDVRLGTFRAMHKRGIQPEALRRYWVEVGVGDVDIMFSWQNLYAHNKELVEPIARRYSFVWEPVQVSISGIDRLVSDAPLHPDRPEFGTRHTVLTGETIGLKVPADDLQANDTGTRFRLKDLCNVELISKDTFRYIGNDISILKDGARIIHWVGPDAVKARAHMPDGRVIEGLVEPLARDSIGRVVQFERFGFVRLEQGEEIEAFFAHT